MNIKATVEFAPPPPTRMCDMQVGDLAVIVADTAPDGFSFGMVGDIVRRTHGGWSTASGAERYWPSPTEIVGFVLVRTLRPGDVVTLTVTA